MPQSNRSRISLISQIVWLLAPILLAEPFGVIPVLDWLSFSDLGPAPFGVALLVLLEVCMIAAVRSEGLGMKQLLMRLGAGWVIQTLGILLLWELASGIEIGSLIVVGVIGIMLLVLHAITGLIYVGIAAVGRKIPHTFFRSNWFPLYVIACLLIFWIISLQSYENHLKNGGMTPGRNTSGDSTYDRAEITFRSPEKAQTQLGRLPRPLKLFQTPNGYIGLTLEGNEIALPFLSGLGTDPIEQAFFDVYSDTVYVKQTGVARSYDLGTQVFTPLPASIQAALQTKRIDTEIQTTSTPSIIVAHGPYIALWSSSSLAGTGETAIYDTRNGNHLTDSQYLGYDQSRLFLFWIDGKGYRLFLNGEKSNVMRVYLDDYAEPFHRLTQDEIWEGMGKVVFGNSEWYTRSKKPLVEFKTSFANEQYGDSKFSVRNVYLLKDGRIAVEIEGALLTLDLRTRQTETLTDGMAIKDLLATAQLLGADDENSHRFINDCAPTTDSEAFSKKIGTKFLFCLK